MPTILVLFSSARSAGASLSLEPLRDAAAHHEAGSRAFRRADVARAHGFFIGAAAHLRRAATFLPPNLAAEAVALADTLTPKR